MSYITDVGHIVDDAEKTVKIKLQKSTFRTIGTYGVVQRYTVDFS
jgi:hypothetical protein